MKMSKKELSLLFLKTDAETYIVFTKDCSAEEVFLT